MEQEAEKLALVDGKKLNHSISCYWLVVPRHLPLNCSHAQVYPRSLARNGDRIVFAHPILGLLMPARPQWAIPPLFWPWKNDQEPIIVMSGSLRRLRGATRCFLEEFNFRDWSTLMISCAEKRPNDPRVPRLFGFNLPSAASSGLAAEAEAAAF